MTFSNRNALSIAELVIYTPAEVLSTFLCIRHGFGPNKGWLFLLIFSLLRLAGASLELATIGFPSSIPLQTSAALLSSVGLSPLLFTTLGLLFRVCKSINKTHHTFIQTIHIRLLRIPIVVGLLLVVIGSDTSANDLIKNGTYPIQLMTKIGVIIVIAVFAIIASITFMFLSHRSHAEAGERRLIGVIAASLPFLLIRLTYVVLITFSHLRPFSVLYGSVVGLGFMAVMQETIVVIMYIGIGLTLPRKIKNSTTPPEGRTAGGRARAMGGIGRFGAFLERPKAFLQRLQGHGREESEFVVDWEGEQDGKAFKT